MFTRIFIIVQFVGVVKIKRFYSTYLPITELLYESHKNIDFELTKANQKLNFRQTVAMVF